MVNLKRLNLFNLGKEWAHVKKIFKPVTREIIRHIKNVPSCENVALFSFPSSIKILMNLFSEVRLQTRNEGWHILMALSLFLPSSLINNPSSVSPLPRSHILPSCQLLSQWFSSSVWHIHRVCEHSSELFNPRNAPNWKTARRTSRRQRVVTDYHPPPPSNPPSPTSTSDREQALLMRRNSLIVWLYRSSW